MRKHCVATVYIHIIVNQEEQMICLELIPDHWEYRKSKLHCARVTERSFRNVFIIYIILNFHFALQDMQIFIHVVLEFLLSYTLTNCEYATELQGVMQSPIDVTVGPVGLHAGGGILPSSHHRGLSGPFQPLQFWALGSWAQCAHLPGSGSDCVVDSQKGRTRFLLSQKWAASLQPVLLFQPVELGFYNNTCASCHSEHTELCSVKLSLNISLHMIHMVVGSHKNVLQSLGHVLLSHASMELFSLGRLLGAVSQSLAIPGQWDFQYNHTSLLIFGKEVILPGEQLFFWVKKEWHLVAASFKHKFQMTQVVWSWLQKKDRRWSLL